MKPGFAPAPIGPNAPMSKNDVASASWVRKVVDVINRSLGGKLNVGLQITLTNGATSTVVRDARISAYSGLLFSPVTAHAAAVEGSVYISSQQDGQATLSHAISNDTDMTFNVAIVG